MVLKTLKSLDIFTAKQHLKLMKTKLEMNSQKSPSMLVLVQIPTELGSQGSLIHTAKNQGQLVTARSLLQFA